MPAQCIGGKPGVDVIISQTAFLVLPRATLDGVGQGVLVPDPRLPNFFIERRDLLDDPQDCGIVPVGLQIVPIGGPDAVDRLRILGYRVDPEEIDLNRVDQLLEDLLLRDEIGVKAPMRHAGFITDIGDTRPQESVPLEDDSGGINELLP